MNNRMLPIPQHLSGSQEISNGSETITARPGKSTKPKGGGTGKKGLFGALKDITHGVSSVAGKISTFSKVASDFIGGTAHVTDSFTRDISGAIGGVENLASSLNGVQETFPTIEIRQAGLKTFRNVQNLARQSLNEMRGVSNTLPGFDKINSPVQQMIRDTVKNLAKPGGTLDLVSVFLQRTRNSTISVSKSSEDSSLTIKPA